MREATARAILDELVDEEGLLCVAFLGLLQQALASPDRPADSRFAANDLEYDVAVDGDSRILLRDDRQ